VINNTIVRWFVSLVFGTVTTLGIFWFMNYMISSTDNNVVTNSIYKTIDFVALKQNIREPDIKKELPPEPVEQKDPPKVPNEVQESKTASTVQAPVAPQLATPSLSGNMAMAGGGAPKILGVMKTPKIDSALTPMVQIKPAYPDRAKRMGVEGYVKVRLNVDATGHVVSIQVIESKPKGVFERSVKRTLKRWKFRPKTVNGKAVAQSGELRLNFKLQDN